MKAAKRKAVIAVKTGRPLLQIDSKQVEELASIDCSYAEMAAVLGCNESTLTRRFAQAIENGRARGRSSLKRQQFKLATDGNPTMLIWLGKVRLGQKDTSVHEVTGKDGGAIAHEISVRFVQAGTQSDDTRLLKP